MDWSSHLSSLLTLNSILEPPRNPVEAPDADAWITIETAWGIKFPDDYKAFLGTYGTGSIDGFLWVLNPISKNQHLNPIGRTLAVSSDLYPLWQSQQSTQIGPSFDAGGGFYPWGVTDNGDELYWNCRGLPSQWSITVCESRGPSCCSYPLNTVAFLVAIVSRQLIVELFPDDFPSEHPAFAVLGE